MDDSEMRSILEYDGLAAAETLTGKSYKEDPAALAAGFGLHVRNVEMKRKVLTEAGDTHYSSTFVEQLDVFHDLGFSVVYTRDFTGRSWDGDRTPIQETYLVLWHPDGVLGTMESYQVTGRNSATIYYNWRPNDLDNMWSLTSSGCFREGLWVGDHDAREALRFNFTQLQKNGKFVSPWIKSPFRWLLCYMDHENEGYDHKAITAAVIAELPASVRTAIIAPQS